MPITTCTEYRNAERALFDPEQACIDAEQQRFDEFVASTPPPTTAQIEAARVQMNKEIKECQDEALARLEALDRQARDSLARLGRLIISWEDLQPAAVALQDVHWNN